MGSATTDRRMGLAGNTAYKTAATALAPANIVLSGEQAVGGVAVKAINAAGVPDRVLCVGQTDPKTNGLWDVNTGTWTRSVDADGNYDWAQGTQIMIAQGTYAFQIWNLTTANPITVGTTALTFSPSVNAGNMAALAASSGSSLVGFIQSGAGAVPRTMQAKEREIVSAADFGADPSAAAAANDAAIAAAYAVSSSVYLNPGTYNYATTITLNGQALYGSNRITTILKPTAAVATGVNLNTNGIISGITLDGSNTANATGILVGSVFSNVAVAKDVVVTKFLGATAYGIVCYWIVQSSFENVRSEGNNKGLYITNPGGAGSFPTFMVFNNCQFITSTLHGAYIINGYGITFNNCDFEWNQNEGVYLLASGVIDRVNFNNCWFERNFESSAAAYQMRCDGSTGGAVLQYVNVESCFFYGGTAKAAIFIKAQSTTFKSNDIPAVAGTVLFNTNSYGWILAQDTTNIVDSTGFMQIFHPSVEGTFLPTIIGTTTAGVGTYTTQIGQYTKIGNLVTVTISLTWTAHTGTGQIRIAGLPFSARAAGGNPAAAIVSDSLAMTAGNYITGYVIDGLPQIYPTQCPTGGGAVVTIPMDTAASIQVSATYRI